MSTSSRPSSFSWHGFQPATLPDVAPWVEVMGRAGHIAKGVVYFIIGFLSFRLAIGTGGEISGAREAITTIGEQPYGRVLLGLTAIGLLCYAAWREVQAIKDTEGDGNDAKGIAKRVGYAVSGLIYLSLGLFAGALATGNGGGGGGSSPTSMLLQETWGRAILGVAGVLVGVVGIGSMINGYRAKFMTKYKLAEMGETQRKVALHAGRAGLITRGIAVVIIAWFLVDSAMQGTAGGDISGMHDALAAIASQTYGKYLIGITGFGLMCYAVHMIMQGCYRRFNVQRV